MNKMNLKLSLTVLIAVFFTMSIKSQVTIGSLIEPDQNSLLDLKQNIDKSSTRGLLLPRMKLVGTSVATPLNAPTKGMFVYNISNNPSGSDGTDGVTEGVYYNDGTKWIRVLDSANSIFFYMPPFLLPTDSNDLISTATYDSGTQTFSVNLYSEYSSQFNLTSTASSTKSCVPSLPVLPSTALEYFITYYDNSVFSNVTVDANGILKYKVISGSAITDKTFMNIVLKSNFYYLND